MTYYEILISHADGECPKLPDEHVDIHYMEPGDYCNWKCPVHQVFKKNCGIAMVRDCIERLKKVKAITSITLYYGGDVKERDCWERKWSNRYQQLIWERRN